MFRVLAAVLLSVLAGCAGPATVCPAVDYGASLTVRLADEWPTGVQREVTVDCPQGESCGRILALPVGEPADFSFSVLVEEVVVTVREAGTDVASVTVEPDWVRVGGSEECGGPMHAEVAVPAP